MSSNDSTSSSRLSQFGLYRTIDARTEEFLKLSRRRQIRQGCACAAVSTAVTVTVVVSILFLYGYSSASSDTLRTSSWFELMNESTDNTLLNDKFQNIKFDRASMNLLPVFFDKNLEDQESSSQKYENPIDINYKRSVFPGSTNHLLAHGKIPGLYSIQYKTYPMLYIPNPRNTEYYMKVRKTREYERIMSYIDKMINEKVALGTRSIRYQQYPTSVEKYSDNPRTAPMAGRKPTRLLTKSKESKTIKVILRSNKKSKQKEMSNMKFNDSVIYDNKNCKCRYHFGTLLDKILKCFQELIKNSSDLPCKKNKTPSKSATEMKNQITQLAVTNRPVTTKMSATTSSTPATTTNIQTDITFTEFAPELLHYSKNLLQKLALSSDNKIRTKEFLSQKSPFYMMTGNNNSKNNIFKSNELPPIKPKSNKFLTNYQNKKTENKKEQKFTPSETKKKVDEGIFTTSTSTTTTSPEKYEEIFQNLLFPETNELEFARLPQKAIKKYSTDIILRPKSHERIPPLNKLHTTTNPPTTTTLFDLLQQKNDKHKKVSTENIIGKTSSISYAPVVPTNKRPFSQITPEDYIMERIRQESKKQHANTMKPLEPARFQSNKGGYNRNISVFDKIKNMLKTKLTHSRRKSAYNSLASQTLQSKTEPKFDENKQNYRPNKYSSSTEYVSKNNYETLPMPYSSKNTSTIKKFFANLPDLHGSTSTKNNLGNLPAPYPSTTKNTIFASLPESYASTTTKSNFGNLPAPYSRTTTNDIFTTLPESYASTTTKNNFVNLPAPYSSTTTNNIFSPVPESYASTSTKNNFGALPARSSSKTAESYLEIVSTPYASTTTTTTSTPYTSPVLETSTPPTQLTKYSQDQFLQEITTQRVLKELIHNGPLPKSGRNNTPFNSREDIWGEDDVYKAALYDSLHGDLKTNSSSNNNSVSRISTESVINVKKRLTSSEEVHAASINNYEKNAWVSSQTEEPYKYLIPVGRKSYLEISRGDWKQKEPHAYDTNIVYDAFDEMEGV